MADTLWSLKLQQARLPCPSLSPRVCSNSVGDAIQLSHPVTPFFSCSQSFPASASFLVSWIFASSGQSIWASASVLPISIQNWLPLGLTGWISLQSKGLSRVFSNTTIRKHQFCFLTCIQVSQETGKVVWYSYLFRNFPQCCNPHSQRL